MMLVLIAPHELGHFIVAKLCNVKVNEFSIGMGPAIFKKQKGETLYSLRAIPIGGYNAMEGEDENSEDPRAFNKQPPLKRIAILIAGVTMNVIIALLICIIVSQINGVAINKLNGTEKGMPAYEAGLQKGDVIVEIDGTATSSWTDVTTAIDSFDPEKQDSLSVVYRRDGSENETELVPKMDKDSGRYMIGIVADVSHDPLRCIAYGAQTTWDLNKAMITAIGMLFTNGVHKDDVAGPVGLVKIVNQTQDYGIQSYLLLLALVSLNLALMNMLPIPALDGGKILFVLLKWISRGRITDEMEFKATIAGFMILMGLFILLTINDVRNMFG